MTIESIIGIAAGLIAIGGAVVSLYKKLKNRSIFTNIKVVGNDEVITDDIA